jgi:hypothetical protein
MPAPKLISLSEKIYRGALRLYPASYRREFGEAMVQLFRDQCRDAWHSGRSLGLVKLWLHTLPDIGKTSITEQIAAIERKSFMKYLKNAPAILLIAGIVLALLSFSHFIMPFHPAFELLCIGSMLAILAKAGIELFRPGHEWFTIAVRTFILMFCFALILPAWAKLKLQASISPPLSHDPFGVMIMFCLFANPVVAGIKFVQFLVQRLKN